jgi:hypothetical protein
LKAKYRQKLELVNALSAKQAENLETARKLSVQEETDERNKRGK